MPRPLVSGAHQTQCTRRSRRQARRDVQTHEVVVRQSRRLERNESSEIVTPVDIQAEMRRGAHRWRNALAHGRVTVRVEAVGSEGRGNDARWTAGEKIR